MHHFVTPFLNGATGHSTGGSSPPPENSWVVATGFLVAETNPCR
jgi:hypothetical protein